MNTKPEVTTESPVPSTPSGEDGNTTVAEGSTMITVTPSSGWDASEVKFPAGLEFGHGKASVIVTASLDNDYRGSMKVSDIAPVTDSRVSWNLEDLPSRESYVEASRLEDIEYEESPSSSEIQLT